MFSFHGPLIKVTEPGLHNEQKVRTVAVSKFSLRLNFISLLKRVCGGSGTSALIVAIIVSDVTVLFSLLQWR